MTTEIIIDVTDWEEERETHSVVFEGEEAVFELSEEGFSAAQIARMAIAARANGLAPEDVLKPNKLLLEAGAWRDVAARHERRKIEGNIREYIGRGIERGEEEEEEDPPAGYVRSLSAEGLRLAESYLLRRVPGHIVNHLRIIRANGGDVQAIGKELHAALARCIAMVEREEEAELQPELA